MNSNCKSGIDVFLNDTIFHGKQDGIYLEAGANDGVYDSITYSYEQIGWTGILVEPLQELFVKCYKNRSHKNSFFNCCLGAREENGTITVPLDNYDNASLVMSDMHKKQLAHDGYGMQYCLLKTFICPFSNIVKEAGVNHIDLCVIDVEGFENSVLTGIINSNVLPSVIVVEHDWSDKEELRNILASHYDLLKEFEHDFVFVKNGI